MSAVHCGPASLRDCRLLDAAKTVQQSIGAEWSDGLPYQPSVEVGVILREIDRHTVKPCVDDFLKEQGEDRTNGDVDSLGVLLLYGAARTRPGIQTKTTVEDIARSIFDVTEVALEVVEAIREGLASQKAILVSVYSPAGGIPGDMYDEGSLLVEASGVEVYHPGGRYQL